MNSLSDLPPPLRQLVSAELRPGEQVVWLGQPDPRLTIKVGYPAWLFFVPWLSMSLFVGWYLNPLKLLSFSALMKADRLFAIFMTVVGIAGMYTPFWIRGLYRHTVYVITNSRALIVEGKPRITMRRFGPAELGTIVKKPGDHGCGDLVLRIDRYKDSDGDERTEEVGFLMIQNVTDVHYLLMQLARGQGPR